MKLGPALPRDPDQCLKPAGNVFLGSGFTGQHAGTSQHRPQVGHGDRLVLTDALGPVRPHELDQATQGTPAQVPDDFYIIREYGAEYRGVVNYYLLTKDAWRRRTLRCIAENEEESPWPQHLYTEFGLAASHKRGGDRGWSSSSCVSRRGGGRAASRTW